MCTQYVSRDTESSKQVINIYLVISITNSIHWSLISVHNILTYLHACVE